MKEVWRSPALKSGHAVTPRGGRTVLKSTDLESKFPGQSCISTTYHCSRVLFPGLPIKGSRHHRGTGRIEKKVLVCVCFGGGVRQHEEGRSQWEGILCLESLGHTVHSTEKEQEHRGRAEISRLPDFVHKSLTEQLCRKLLLTKLQKKQGHIPAGKSSKETLTPAHLHQGLPSPTCASLEFALTL